MTHLFLFWEPLVLFYVFCCCCLFCFFLWFSCCFFFVVTDFSPYGMVRVKLAHFRRGKWAHLFSMNKNCQKSIQYFIAFSDYFSQILSPKQKILLQKQIHGHRNIYICKSYYFSHSVRGKLTYVYLPYKSRNVVKNMDVLYGFLGRNISRKAEVYFEQWMRKTTTTVVFKNVNFGPANPGLPYCFKFQRHITNNWVYL